MEKEDDLDFLQSDLRAELLLLCPACWVVPGSESLLSPDRDAENSLCALVPNLISERAWSEAEKN